MCYERFGHKAVDFCGKIYVFGGTDKNFMYLKSFEVYDPNADTWKIISLSNVSKLTYVSIFIEIARININFHLNSTYMLVSIYLCVLVSCNKSNGT